MNVIVEEPPSLLTQLRAAWKATPLWLKFYVAEGLCVGAAVAYLDLKLARPRMQTIMANTRPLFQPCMMTALATGALTRAFFYGGLCGLCWPRVGMALLTTTEVQLPEVQRPEVTTTI